MDNDKLFSFFVASLNNSSIKADKDDGNVDISALDLTQEQLDLLNEEIRSIEDTEERGFWEDNWQMLASIGISSLLLLIQLRSPIWKVLKSIMAGISYLMPCYGVKKGLALLIADIAANILAENPLTSASILSSLKKILKAAIKEGLPCLQYVMDFVQNSNDIPADVKQDVFSPSAGTAILEGLEDTAQTLFQAAVIAAIAIAAISAATAIATGVVVTSPVWGTLAAIVALAVWLGIISEEDSSRYAEVV